MKEPERTMALAMCPVCAECGAQKHKINPDCQTCVNCENREGYLRDRVRGEVVDVMVTHKAFQEIMLEKHLGVDKE
jgi:hypothetical protein